MKNFIFLITVLLFHQLPQVYSQKTSAYNIVFVMDCSGSMWQKLGTETKMSVAKRVLNDLTNKISSDSKLALIAYGHNSKSDCNDIETLLPLSIINKNIFQEKINGLEPKGKTPIAKSMRHALNLIKDEKQVVNVVLISDGLETCDGDACQLIQEAKEQGVKIVVHVIGFVIEEANQATLECLAQAGNGQYFPVSSADELLAALEKTIQVSELDGGYLRVKVTHENKLMDAGIRIYKKNEQKELLMARTYEESQTNPRIFLLKPGEYRMEVNAIRLDGKPQQTINPIIITAKDTLSHILDFSTGSLELLVTMNESLADATLQVFKKGTKETIVSGRSYTASTTNPKRFQILPGFYDVEIASVKIDGRPMKRFENIQIIASQLNKITQNFETGEISIGARQGTTLVDATISISKNGINISGGRSYASSSSNPKTFILEPGKYKIVLKPLKPKNLTPQTIEVHLKANDQLERIVEWK